MKSITLIVILSIFFTMVYTEPVNVEFRIITRNMTPDSSLYITGSHDLLGNWNPAIVPLRRWNDSLWTLELSFLFGDTIEYKFTQGSWATEPLNKNQIPYDNFCLTLTNDTTIMHQFSRWRSIESSVTGTLIIHEDITSEGLLPRNIRVWLPTDYYSSKRRRYPVLYLHDGQNLFDNRTSKYLSEWWVDESADSLIRTGLIEPIIIVGIDNTSQRTPEYSNSKTGTRYREFVINELKPFIDKNYRTKPGRKYTAVGGSSLGGLIAFIFVWNYDHLFSKAICMSPAFKIDEFDMVTSVQNYTGPKKDIQLYIDNGGIELEQQLQPGIDEMLETLNNHGYRQDSDYLWVKDTSAEHSEKAWSKRMPLALTFLFGKQSR
ncbi:MAG: histidine kinase [Candidatus Marinimicrobia bacterium]|nr:histidine kinase [Candidatus Neomarinimicrobiota bacterium]